MIKTFRSKPLRELFETGASRKIGERFAERSREILAVLNNAKTLPDLSAGGVQTHPLHQFKPTRYAAKVSGAWRITFEFANGDAFNVDFEQYH